VVTAPGAAVAGPRHGDGCSWSSTWPLWLFTIATATFGAIAWIGLGVLRRHRRRVAWRAARND
jgi:hypothetical protein